MPETATSPNPDFSTSLDEAGKRYFCNDENWRFFADFPGFPSLDPRHLALAASLRNGDPERDCERDITFVLDSSEPARCPEPGTVLLRGGGELHGAAAPEPGARIRWLRLGFSKKGVLRCWEGILDGRNQRADEVASCLRSRAVVSLAMSLWDDCLRDPGRIMDRENLKCLIKSLLLDILCTEKPGHQLHRHEQVIAAIQQYIRENLEGDLRLNTLAQVSGYSPSFLHRTFVRYAGKTPGEFVNEVRLERAQELLKQDYTVEAVAESVGISSLSYFGRFFKKRMNFSPRRWCDLVTR